jgi:glycosyltransferase involved in cell wall biosynthesis
MPTKSITYGDVAGWDTYMIELLGKRDDIDLTVIAAHSGLKRRVVSFEMEGVHYYFVRVELATLLKRLIHSPAIWNKLNPIRPIVRRIVKKSNPRILALIGAENAHISGTILGIKGIPLIVRCQTIYNNPKRGESEPLDVKNAYVERLIFKDLKYVAVASGVHSKLFRQYNHSAYNFKWPLGNVLPTVQSLEKEFDFVNFAMAMVPKKGFNDALLALFVVKKQYPNVRLNLVGGGSKEVMVALHSLVDQLHLENNVVFTPFFARQADLFQHLQKSRFAILPCKMDSVSSTIRQAMHYGLPVICYKTDGTPKLNKDKECVLIAENGNVEDLANKMIMLLSDKKKEEELRNNAKEYSRRWNDADSIVRQMTDVFYSVVDNFYNGTQIPDFLLNNED